MRHNLNILNNKQTLLVAANGDCMPVAGTTSLTAGANGTSYRIHALVSPAITEDMLVSYNNLISLEIIPRNFPNVRVQNCRSIKQFKDILIGEFPTVLSDDLNPEPMKTDKPMHITLLPGATPKKVLSARRVPLRYEKEATKTIKELIDRGVITPMNDTSDWCSPAFFVPKADNARVRLVTDYTELNKHVN